MKSIARFRLLPEPARFAVSLGILLLVWIAAAWMTGDATVLPPPGIVLQITIAEIASGNMAYHVSWTLQRVVLAFSLAMGIGLVIGALLGLSDPLDRWFRPWVSIFLNVPALVVIVLAYLWIGLNEVAAVIAVAVNKTAMVAVMIREGVRSVDPSLAELARAYRFSPGHRLCHVWLPQIWPFLAAAMRNGMAIIWKIVLVVEFLGRSNGVGFQIHLYFQLFETGYVLAYALSFVAVMLAIEYTLLVPIERRAGEWRRRTRAFT